MKRTLYLLLCLLYATTQDAHAYIDPGGGSLLFQMILAAVLGSLVTMKRWWRGLFHGFSRNSGKDDRSG